MIAWLGGKLLHRFAPYFVVVLGLALIATAGGWGVTALKLGTVRLQLSKAETALEKEKSAHQQLIGDAEAFARGVAEIERKKDQAHQQRLLEIESELKKAELEADARERRLAADHRAGLVRVRREVCEGSASPNVSAGTAASAGVGIRGTAAGENPAVLAVRAGAEGDYELRQCRAYVIAQAQRCPQQHQGKEGAAAVSANGS